MEKWKYILGYTDKYKISSLGRVKSLNRHLIMSPSHSRRTGYWKINLYKNGLPTTFLIHRLVAIHFINNPKNKPEVNHKWGDKSDNRACSLEWATEAENSIHAIKHRLFIAKSGENCWSTSLSNKFVLEIFNDPLPSFRIAKKHGIPSYIVYQIKNGQNWSSVTGKKYKATYRKIKRHK